MPRGGSLRTADPQTPTKPAPAGSSGAVSGVYSIGAVASILGIPTATLRSWEGRYGVITPQRARGGHRLYSRAQVEQLRSVLGEMATGVSAADAHRSLAQRLRTTREEDRAHVRPRLLVLVAERDEYSAKLIEYLLRTEGFGVEVALDPDEARRGFGRTQPDLTIVELLVGGGEGDDLCRWLKERGAGPILVVSSLDAADRALSAGADAFLRKPVAHLQLISVVLDLIGAAATRSHRG